MAGQQTGSVKREPPTITVATRVPVGVLREFEARLEAKGMKTSEFLRALIQAFVDMERQKEQQGGETGDGTT